jgi:hypothetical protein
MPTEYEEIGISYTTQSTNVVQTDPNAPFFPDDSLYFFE